jgi:hypothetical protein
MGRKFGQAGLDFLMTYGWALVIIVLVIGVLFALGIFNVGSFAGNRVSGFTSVGVAAYAFQGGDLTVRFVNRVGSQINITGIGHSFETSNTTSWVLPSGGPTLPISLSSGTATGDLKIANQSGYNANDYYSVTVTINYTDLKTNFNYSDSGTISGKAV